LKENAEVNKLKHVSVLGSIFAVEILMKKNSLICFWDKISEKPQPLSTFRFLLKEVENYF